MTSKKVLGTLALVKGLALPQDATVMQHTQKLWESNTFSGHRHTLTIQFRAVDEGSKFVEAAPDIECDLPGYLCAEIKVTSVDAQIALNILTCTVEVLTLEDA
jgi:hypothetical protein